MYRNAAPCSVIVTADHTARMNYTNLAVHSTYLFVVHSQSIDLVDF